MDNANKFLDYLINETNTGAINWKAKQDYFTASTNLQRKGILLQVGVRKSGDAVSVYLQPNGQQFFKLPDLDKTKLQALGKAVEKAIEVPAEVLATLDRVVNDFLQ